jgi:hypothetical protein
MNKSTVRSLICRTAAPNKIHARLSKSRPKPQRHPQLRVSIPTHHSSRRPGASAGAMRCIAATRCDGRHICCGETVAASRPCNTGRMRCLTRRVLRIVRTELRSSVVDFGGSSFRFAPSWSRFFVRGIVPFAGSNAATWRRCGRIAGGPTRLGGRRPRTSAPPLTADHFFARDRQGGQHCGRRAILRPAGGADGRGPAPVRGDR